MTLLIWLKLFESIFNYFCRWLLQFYLYFLFSNIIFWYRFKRLISMAFFFLESFIEKKLHYFLRLLKNIKYFYISQFQKKVSNIAIEC